MIFGFAYLLMVLVITFIWVFLAIIKKPDLKKNIIIIKNNLKADDGISHCKLQIF